MTIFQAISLMLAFGMLIIALITLIIAIIKLTNKK